MGGYGSGRHSGRRVVEQSLWLKLPDLKAKGFLNPDSATYATWHWSRGDERIASISMQCRLYGHDRGHLTFDYAVNGEARNQVITLEPAAMRFGGVRWWALCPVSGRRCSTLVYAPAFRGWISVKASRFAYRTQHECPLDRQSTMRDRYEQRYRKLSKYARRPTKDRFRERWFEADERWEAMFGFYAAGLMERLTKLDALASRPTRHKRRRAVAGTRARVGGG